MAVALAVMKLYMFLTKMPRARLGGGLVEMSIRNHWMSLLFLLVAQLVTTVYARDTAALLGCSPGQVFAWHAWFAYALVAEVGLLVGQKLFFMSPKTSKPRTA